MKLRSSHLRLRAPQHHALENFTGASTPHSPAAFPTRAAGAADEPGPGVARTTPGRLDIYFAAAVFACFALIATLGCCMLAVGEWLLNSWRRMKHFLTLHRQCSWCSGYLHYAPLGFLGTTTHGICPTCLDRMKGQIATQPFIHIPHRTTTGTTI